MLPAPTASEFWNLWLQEPFFPLSDVRFPDSVLRLSRFTLVLWVSYPALPLLRLAALDIRFLRTHHFYRRPVSCDWFACRFGDPAFPLFRLETPFPVIPCIEAFLPDVLKVSWNPSRAKSKITTYPQARRLVVEKMAYKFAGQTNTAPTPCMEAVKIVRGRGREEESAARSMCVSTITCR